MSGRYIPGEMIQSWQLRPQSYAKQQPSCVPAALSQDYYEACAIRDLSPKASATLVRRVLQGMIRDFCGISGKRLVEEINTLRKNIDEGMAPKGVSMESVDAIDRVREIGNIGAHMEKDINVIVDVDSDEAQSLIELVELLFEVWYVERDRRQKRLAHIELMSANKKAQKLAALPPKHSLEM